LSIEIQPGETLDDAVKRSIGFEEWKEKLLEMHPEYNDVDIKQLIEKYLDEVHLTSFDIKEIIDGQKILEEDDPDLEDGEGNENDGEIEENILEQAADYSGVDLDELLERMEKVKDKQSKRHGGGSHWIGSGGISPFGHGGAAKGGIRIGGSGGGKMARKVIGNKRYFPVDLNARIKDDNIDAALASLKGVLEESAEIKLDIPKTIKDGLKRGGLFLPETKEVINEKMQILLLIDNGGYSMDPHIRSVMRLFKKMKTRFAHDLEVFYFHNTIYGKVYSDAIRTKAVSLEKLLNYDKNYRLFIVGDAAMAPYELTQASASYWIALKEKFKKSAWLNPDPVRSWYGTATTVYLSKIFSMYPLTPKGIEVAIIEMNKKKIVN
jgi:uncharacterized protein with von Willebrand factor type A (vWA) domain